MNSKITSIRITLLTVLIILSKLLSAQDIQVVAHRGGVKWGPENTIATFMIAIEKGVDYLEMDVRQTKDGEFILMHDKSVSRTTNGQGLVENLTLAEIKDLDAGSWYSSSFKNEPVPTLREVLQAIDGKVLPDLDFKAGDSKELVELLAEEGFLDGRPLTLYSGNHQLIQEIQSLTDKIQVRPGIKSSFTDLEAALNPPIINLSWKKYSPKLKESIHAAGAKCFVNCLFTGNRKLAIKKAVKANVDFIQTDKLDFLLKLLEEEKSVIKQ